MKREKDRLFSFLAFYKFKKYFNNNNTVLVSIVLSFSLHLFIIIFISILSQNAPDIKSIEKLDSKAIEIQINDNLFAYFGEKENSSKNKISFSNNDFVQIKNENEKIKTDEILKSEKKEEKLKEDGEILDEKGLKEIHDNKESSEDIDSKQQENKTLNSSSSSIKENSESVDNQYPLNLLQTDDNNINSEKQAQFSYENIVQYAINIKTLFTYPKDALKLGIQGIVKLKLHIDIHGKVLEAILLESSGSKILDSYTLKQANQLLFSFPDNKKPDSSFWIIIKVVYSIKSNVTIEAGN